jgi:hypothetical protein
VSGDGNGAIVQQRGFSNWIEVPTPICRSPSLAKPARVHSFGRHARGIRPGGIGKLHEVGIDVTWAGALVYGGPVDCMVVGNRSRVA